MPNPPKVTAGPTGHSTSINTTGRSGFFQVGDNWFADAWYNFDHPLELDFERLGWWLATADPNEIVIGRRLKEAEVDIILDNRDDVDADSYAQILPDQAKLPMGLKVP